MRKSYLNSRRSINCGNRLTKVLLLTEKWSEPTKPMWLFVSRASFAQDLNSLIPKDKNLGKTLQRKNCVSKPTKQQLGTATGLFSAANCFLICSNWPQPKNLKSCSHCRNGTLETLWLFPVFLILQERMSASLVTGAMWRLQKQKYESGVQNKSEGEPLIKRCQVQKMKKTASTTTTTNRS